MTSLNKEEKELLSSVENDEWKSINNVDQAIKSYQSYANHQINQRVIYVYLEA
jgi:hypothetical protein